MADGRQSAGTNTHQIHNEEQRGMSAYQLLISMRQLASTGPTIMVPYSISIRTRNALQYQLELYNAIPIYTLPSVI